MGNKKAALFLGGFLFEFFYLLGAFGFGEPPMGYCGRDHEGHDYGDNNKKGDVERHREKLA